MIYIVKMFHVNDCFTDVSVSCMKIIFRDMNVSVCTGNQITCQTITILFLKSLSPDSNNLMDITGINML